MIKIEDLVGKTIRFEYMNDLTEEGYPRGGEGLIVQVIVDVFGTAWAETDEGYGFALGPGCRLTFLNEKTNEREFVIEDWSKQ